MCLISAAGSKTTIPQRQTSTMFMFEAIVCVYVLKGIVFHSLKVASIPL